MDNDGFLYIIKSLITSDIYKGIVIAVVVGVISAVIIARWKSYREKTRKVKRH